MKNSPHSLPPTVQHICFWPCVVRFCQLALSASEPALTHRPAIAAVHIARQHESRHLPTPASYTAVGEQHGPADAERAFTSLGHYAGNLVHDSLAYGIDLQAGCQSFLSSRLTRLRPAWRLATRNAPQGTSTRAMQQVHCHINTALPARVLTSSTLVSVVRADCSRHDHHEEHAHDCACHQSGSAFNVSRRQLLWAAAGVSLAAQTNLPAAAAGAPAGKTQYSADGMCFNAAWHRKV